MVFFISAFVHELIITGVLGFFYPVMLFMFGGLGGKYTKTAACAQN